MPKRYKPFDVMKDRGSRERLSRRQRILYGAIGPPFDHMDLDSRVAWLDLVQAAPPGRLERHHMFFLELTAGILSKVRLGEANKGTTKLLGRSLRQMGLTPGIEASPSAMLDAFKGRGPVN